MSFGFGFSRCTIASLGYSPFLRCQLKYFIEFDYWSSKIDASRLATIAYRTFFMLNLGDSTLKYKGHSSTIFSASIPLYFKTSKSLPPSLLISLSDS